MLRGRKWRDWLEPKRYSFEVVPCPGEGTITLWIAEYAESVTPTKLRARQAREVAEYLRKCADQIEGKT